MLKVVEDLERLRKEKSHRIELEEMQATRRPFQPEELCSTIQS